MRETGIEKSLELAEVFGSSWIVNEYIPKAKEAFEDGELGYLFRINAIMAVRKVVKYLSKEEI